MFCLMRNDLHGLMDNGDNVNAGGMSCAAVKLANANNGSAAF